MADEWDVSAKVAGIARRCMPVRSCVIAGVQWTYVPIEGWVEPARATRLYMAARALRGADA